MGKLNLFIHIIQLIFFSCGWTPLNIFSCNNLIDESLGHVNIPFTVSIYQTISTQLTISI